MPHTVQTEMEYFTPIDYCNDMTMPKNFHTESRGCTFTSLHLPVGAHARQYVLYFPRLLKVQIDEIVTAAPMLPSLPSLHRSPTSIGSRYPPPANTAHLIAVTAVALQL